MEPDTISTPKEIIDGTYPAVRAFLDHHVLQFLADHDRGSGFDWIAFHLSAFANEWITKDMAGAICRSLRDRKYVTFERGLFTEEGEVAGAGYAITDQGREYLRTINYGPDYVIWSNEHRCWWAPNEAGYRMSLGEAGRYTREKALAICKHARGGRQFNSIPSEVPMPLADAEFFWPDDREEWAMERRRIDAVEWKEDEI